MGYGSSYICKECGNKGTILFGVGMMYPLICEETKQSALLGEMGKGWFEFVNEHPNGSFDCSNSIYICDCGGWRASPNNDYYVPDDVQEFGPYFNGEDHFIGLVKHSQHRCTKCRKKMHRISEKKLSELKCPKCGGDVEWELKNIMWD